MATKKEMVAELVALGANEAEIKDLRNPELEALLEKAKEASVPIEGGGEPQEPASADVAPEVVVTAPVTTDEAPVTTDSAADGVEVLRETSVQLGIFRDHIYNVKHKGAKVIVQNLGYGDAYVDADELAVVGKSQRLDFKGRAEFENIERLYFASASQPTLQIIEVK